LLRWAHSEQVVADREPRQKDRLRGRGPNGTAKTARAHPTSSRMSSKGLKVIATNMRKYLSSPRFERSANSISDTRSRGFSQPTHVHVTREGGTRRRCQGRGPARAGSGPRGAPRTPASPLPRPLVSRGSREHPSSGTAAFPFAAATRSRRPGRTHPPQLATAYAQLVALLGFAWPEQTMHPEFSGQHAHRHHAVSSHSSKNSVTQARRLKPRMEPITIGEPSQKGTAAPRSFPAPTCAAPPAWSTPCPLCPPWPAAA
jgi:hypothetical protein